MKKLAVLLGLSVFSSSIFAIPNVWTSGFGQGWAVYRIENSQGDELFIACNAGYDDTTDHDVTFTTKSGKRYSNFDLLVDDRYVTPMGDTTTRNGENQWIKFVEAIKKGKSIEIYIANKKRATFKPRAGSRSELTSLCGPFKPSW